MKTEMAAKILIFRLELVREYAEKELGRPVERAEVLRLAAKNPEGFRRLLSEAQERLAA